MDLTTANKQMTDILDMFKNASSFDLIRFENEFKVIKDKAEIIIKLHYMKGK